MEGGEDRVINGLRTIKMAIIAILSTIQNLEDVLELMEGTGDKDYKVLMDKMGKMVFLIFI